MQTAKDVHDLLAAADTDAGLFVPRAALATLLRTSGSAFRRSGSRMLIGGNGQVVRGFSGGCPEADIVLRARRVIDSGRIERATYNRERGLDLLIEMGCGGELEIVLEPLAQRSSLRFLDVIADLWRSRSAAMMASIFPRAESTQMTVARLIWRNDEIVLDEMRDDASSSMIIAAAAGMQDRHECRRLHIAGADVDVLYEPILPPVRLILIGTNAVVDAVARAAHDLAWPVDRIEPKTASPDALAPSAGAGNGASACDSNTFILCMTYQFERDVEFAAAALATAAPYVGILGSHQRAAQMRVRLEEYCGSAALARLYTPAGLSIGSEDAEQIAISLIAEILSVATCKSGAPLSRSSESIHARGMTDMSAE